ncbi:MAG: TIM barrel protein [Methanobrevibacter sp.]|jgi:deoxyribonuclease-4|nr:TIM barrel protein [Candidatus Methanoflexus mossambicus]
MIPKIIFGPAGRPINFKGPGYKASQYIKNEGLDAYEYQGGRGLKIGEKSARILKNNSNENNVLVSIHAPYFINLSSNKEKIIENSIDILFKAAQVADWMGAYRIVFHPGYYLKNNNSSFDKVNSLKIAISTIKKLFEKLDENNINNFCFAPETTGKKSQLGNLEEIIAICNEFDQFKPTIDFAHLYARNEGNIKTKQDFNSILSKLEDELNIDRLHCHFTRIEYSKSGEKRHHTLAESNFGLEPELLLKSLVENDFKATIICESPLLDEDALILKNIYENLI